MLDRPPPRGPMHKRPPLKLPSEEVRQRQIQERLAVLTTEAGRQELGDNLWLILLRSEVGLLREINATKQLARRAWVVWAALAQSGLLRLRRCQEGADRRR